MSRIEQPSWASTPLKQSESFEFKNEELGHSVDDLLEAIEKNISSTSVNARDLPSEDTSVEADSNGTIGHEADPSPIRPLNLKQHTQLQERLLSSVFTIDDQHDYSTPVKGDIMQDIPRLPSVASFDELEFNTRVNRTASLSRISGPRQMSNSAIVRTFSAKLPVSDGYKSSSKTTRDNSPSKKSVCFEESPPKVIKYDELTPEHSDNSIDNEDNFLEDRFESNWDANVKQKLHPLPPLPPKHVIRTPSPTKDTSLGSSDDSQDFNLTKEDLNRSAMSLEQRLDLVLNNDEVSERIQNDESFRGSGSPLKSMSKQEEELIYSIKNKDKIKEEEELRNAAEHFEDDRRNTDKYSHFLRLDPQLRRANSNSSLKEEERCLQTKVVVKSEEPIISETGLRNVNLNNLPVSTDDLISESTMDSFASATEIIEEDSDKEKQQQQTTAGQSPLASGASTQSISTINNNNDGSLSNTPESHKKQLSISGSITSGLSYISSIIHRRTDSGRDIKIEIPDDANNFDDLPSPTETPLALKPDFTASPLNVHDTIDIAVEESKSIVVPHSAQSSAIQSPLQGHFTTEELSLIENQTEHSTPVLKNQDRQKDFALADDFKLGPPFSLEAEEDHEDSFTDGFKGTGLFNSSDFMDQSYTRSTSSKAAIFDNIEPHNEVRLEIENVEPLDTIADELLIDETASLNSEISGIKHSSIKKENAEAELPNNEELINGDVTNLVDEPADESVITSPISEERLVRTVEQPQSSETECNEVANSSAEVKIEDCERLAIEEVKESDFKSEVEQTSEQPEDSIDISPLDDELDSNVFIQDEYRSLKPPLTEDPKANLPSYNSLLFHDKEPEPENFELPPTDYIAIWNSQPKPSRLEPKYSVRTRRSAPPKKVLKLLSRTFEGDSESENEIETSPTRYEIKREGSLGISSKSNSFVTKSVSRSSFINFNIRRSSIIEKLKSEADDSDVSNDSLLPDLSASSNFASAFKEWDLEPTKTNAEKLIQLKKPDSLDIENIRSIWGTGDAGHFSSADSRTPSVDAGKINDMLSKNGTETEDLQVKSSNAQSKAVVENSENLAIHIEYDHHPLDDFYHEPSVEKIMPVQKQLKESLTKQQQLIKQHNFRVVSSSPTKRTLLQADDPIMMKESKAKVDSSEKRLISGNSLASGFDLADDFDRIVQLQDHTYAVREKKEVIIAGNNQDPPNDKEEEFFDDILDQKELAKPTVPTVNDIQYKNARYHKFGERVPSARQPLSNLSDNQLNVQKESANLHARLVSAANSQRKVSSASVVHGAEDTKIDMKKQRQEVDQRSVKSHQSFAQLPTDDKGRLYVHVNYLTEINLDEIPNHKATFKLYLDNGKHRISTPKMALTGTNVPLDKEFEVAIEENITDFHLTVKVAYNRPENELVEVYDKIPIKTNRFSQIFGLKQKYRIEKSYISRKRVNDTWDHRFANDGSFAKNKITFETNDNEFTGQTKNYVIELFNEWSTQKQSGKSYKVPPYLVAKLDVTMLYIPRTSPLETLPPSIKVAKSVAGHLIEQENIRFEGFLFQEGGDCDLWKRRFFKIEGTSLIAHSETLKKPRAKINLLKVIDIVHNGKKSKNNRNITEEVLMSDTFKLVFKNGEIIYFNAETTQARNQWINILERVVELNRFHQPWVKLISEKEYK